MDGGELKIKNYDWDFFCENLPIGSAGLHLVCVPRNGTLMTLMKQMITDQ